MSETYIVTRRQVLHALVAVPAISTFPGSVAAEASGTPDVFLRTSETITGTTPLSPDIAQRIQNFLTDRVDQFAHKLTDLSETMEKAGGSREQMLRILSDAQIEFALEIAKPWYLGYVGKPSNFVLKDDAAFATFLQAQSYQKIIEEVPRPTYPNGSAGWWSAPPPGVDAPQMPEQITSWTFHPGGPSQIMAPDPAWKAYATADHASIEDARTAKPAKAG